MFRRLINSSDFSTGQLQAKLSHLGQTATVKIENLLWTRRISPHVDIHSCCQLENQNSLGELL